MPATKKPSADAPKPAQQQHDKKRFENRADERLSDEAGYGRADSTPGKTCR